MKKIRKLLIANRGEIAIRISRAANEMGIRTVAIFAAEDKLSLHRFKSDEAYQVGMDDGSVKAYLNIDDILRIARDSQCDAVHPGYGFLSENPDFADACRDAGPCPRTGSSHRGRHANRGADAPRIPPRRVLGRPPDRIGVAVLPRRRARRSMDPT